jgi:hypothetical protein
VLLRNRERDALPFTTKDGSTIRESGSRHELRAGSEGVRLYCCCVPPYSDDDTYFT